MKAEHSATKKVVAHSTIYATGNILRQLVSFIMLPVYTHYLTPADYGVVGLISFAIAIFETLFGGKLAAALPKFFHGTNDTHEKNLVISTAFIVTGFISSITVTIIFLTRDFGASALFGSTQYGLVLGICGIQMLTQAFEFYGLTHLRLLEKPIAYVIVNLTKLAVQLALNIWLVVHLEMGVMGVAISGLLATSLFGAALSAYTISKTGFGYDRAIAKKMLQFSWPLWLSGIASLYIFSSSRYFIRIFDSLTNVGLYELGAKFAAIISILVWGPFSQFWKVEQYRIIKQSNAEDVFQSAFTIVCFLLAVVGLGISIFSETVIRFMSDPAFQGASLVVPFLVLMTIFACLVDFLNASFLARSETRWLSTNNYLMAAILTGLYFLFIPALGYVGAAIALATLQLIQLLSIQRAAKKKHDFNLPLMPLLQMITISSAGYLVAISAYRSDNPILEILIKGSLYLVFCGALLIVLLRNDGVKSRIWRMINSYRE